MSALCLCLLAAFLLVQSDGQASSLLVSVAAQIDDRKDVAPMVLAETLMGLDAVYADQTNVFGGSPLFLQLWLCDKLNLLEPIPRNRVHETRGFVRRDFVVVYEREELWVQHFQQVTEEMISWQINWADLPTMSLSNMGRERMMLVGMFAWTFYIPYRILRQLGVRQRMPPYEYFLMPPFKFSCCRFY